MKRMPKDIVWLGVVAIVAALCWRIEIELHGWEGLDWVGYFHWSIPFGAVMFLIWLAATVPIDGPSKRAAFLATTALVAFGWYRVVQFSLFYHFNGGPSGFVQFLAVGEKRFFIYANLIYAVVPLTPIIFSGILAIFGERPSALRLAPAILIFVAATPISTALLAVLNHRGGSDAIHTMKSGVIIPFLIVGLGILSINGKREPVTDEALNSV
ncbi:MAG: hypothetical protein SWQ30_22155 [Thermodesulfobacteriota bacterium]|nr:hypothetical protein [Thermodesulfobacteriota bacterium]